MFLSRDDDGESTFALEDNTIASTTLKFALPTLETKFLTWYTRSTSMDLLAATQEQFVILLCVVSPQLLCASNLLEFFLRLCFILVPVGLFFVVLFRLHERITQIDPPLFVQIMIGCHVIVSTLLHLLASSAAGDNNVNDGYTCVVTALLLTIGTHFRLRFLCQLSVLLLQVFIFAVFAYSVRKSKDGLWSPTLNTIALLGVALAIVICTRSYELRMRADFKHMAELQTEQRVLQTRVDVFKRSITGSISDERARDLLLSPLERAILLLKRIQDTPATSTATKGVAHSCSNKLVCSNAKKRDGNMPLEIATVHLCSSTHVFELANHILFLFCC
eukprot:c10049_g1_i2.p1 GENE.c10049_g1_i2~~c10049_g1_i2.p1  ORF type:complete len:333 (+),score=66.84 c10049_g1_i2:339-1337(+)